MQRCSPQSWTQLQPHHPDQSLQPRTGMSQLLPLPWSWDHPTTHLRSEPATRTREEAAPFPHKSLPSPCPSNDVRGHKRTFESWLWPLLATAVLNPVLARTRTPLLYVVYKRTYYEEEPLKGESEIIYRIKVTNFEVLILFS